MKTKLLASLLTLAFAGCGTVPTEAPKPTLTAEQLEAKKREVADGVAKLYDAGRDHAFAEKGNCAIKGQAFLTTRGGDVRVGAGKLVMAVPSTPWFEAVTLVTMTSEIVGMLPAEQKASFAKGVRTTQADAQGNFEFTDLAPGQYRLSTTIIWEVPGRYGMYPTGGPVEILATATPDGPRVMLTR